jgi:hypothetical protein
MAAENLAQTGIQSQTIRTAVSHILDEALFNCQQKISITFKCLEHHGLLLNIEIQKWMDDVIFINQLINHKAFDKTCAKYEMCFIIL